MRKISTVHLPFSILDMGCSRLLTSDEDVGRVGLVPGLCGDAQSVETLVLFVEVGESQCGLVSTPVHLVPFGRRQQHVCVANDAMKADGRHSGKFKGRDTRKTHRLCTTAPLAGSGAALGR